jgi:hypothetical protein
MRNQIGGCGLDYLAQDRDKWQALVNMVMNIQIPFKAVLKKDNAPQS